MDREVQAQPSLSVVIPVYNSEATLRDLVARLEAALPLVAKRFEVLLVNDGSRDNSWEAICKLSVGRPWLRGITLLRNYGQHNALLCGIRAARHELIVTMDDDLQHPPEEVQKLLVKMAEGHDVVYGVPETEQHGMFRDLASWLTKLALQNAMGAATARRVSAFRIFRTRLREAFAAYHSPNVCLDVLLTWGTPRFGWLVVRHEARPVGASNYSFYRLLTHAMNMLTGFSTMPLQLASLMGFGLALFGVVVLAYVVGRYLIQGASVPGFAFLASIVAIFSGAQLLCLGIIGEYLARMHFTMMGRPTYVAGQEIGDAGQSGGVAAHAPGQE
ncbi:MAG: glycosyltransferase family 2 protein [Planctomycetota bacterium]